jgi:hypothetical protein
MNKIYAIGDVHGYFNRLNIFINKKQPTIILQCGDFGYFPKEFNKTYLTNTGHIKKWKPDIVNPHTDIYWCDGNHEDHEALKNRTIDLFWTNVFYQPRGTVRMLPDGRNVLFMGGALSIDKEYRTAGYDWFPEETITQRDIMNLPDVNIDIVITHTAPKEFLLKDPRFEFRKVPDPSREALSVVLNKYKPRKFYFGHFHVFQQGKYNNTEWTALGDITGNHKWNIEV